ncbi:lyase [Streptomyces sp. JJ66]|uniref:terpene synthase family protein n=1 Tax=Streptomyces sp. JJ66 TaxID=2803843 RepID=UPI001C55FC5B|nr:terpene synthase family protein [Streptomyces sp. JJ66]MBW1602462.1 lyase [Streptomyces sp. JJ66]
MTAEAADVPEAVHGTAHAMPDFQHPFIPRVHPRAAEANQDAARWVRGHGLIDDDAFTDFANIAFGYLAARVLPEAPYERVLTLARWMAWSFVLDDQHDHLIRTGELDAWTAVAAVVAGRQEPSPDDNPLIRAFVEVKSQVLAGLPASVHPRYRHHLAQMMDAMDREAAHRTAPQPPSIAAYVLTRRHSSMLPAMMDITEGALGVEVPPESHGLPAFQELRWSAIDIVSWTNDIVSYRKESSCGDVNNLVLLLVHQHGLSLPDAVGLVTQRIKDRVQDLLHARERLPRALQVLGLTASGLQEAALTCADNLQDWVIGTDLWERTDCTRYRESRWINGHEGAYNRPDLLVTRTASSPPSSSA